MTAEKLWRRLTAKAKLSMFTVGVSERDNTDTSTHDLGGTTKDDEVVALYYLDCRTRNLREKTLTVKAERLGILLDIAHHAGKPILEVTKGDIQRYIYEHCDRLSPITINSRLRSWRAFFNWAATDGLIDRPPTADIPLMKTDDEPKQALSPGQIQHFLRSWDRGRFEGRRNYVLTLVMLDGMIRVGESLTLRIRDFDQTAGLLDVYHTKGRKYRRVPISFRTSKQLYRFIHGDRKPVPGELIFCQREGMALATDRITKAFMRQSKRAGVHVNPHALRRAGATLAANAGMSPHMLQKILGHADIRTTMVYVSADIETMKIEHDKYSPVANLGA